MIHTTTNQSYSTGLIIDNLVKTTEDYKEKIREIDHMREKTNTNMKKSIADQLKGKLLILNFPKTYPDDKMDDIWIGQVGDIDLTRNRFSLISKRCIQFTTWKFFNKRMKKIPYVFLDNNLYLPSIADLESKKDKVKIIDEKEDIKELREMLVDLLQSHFEKDEPIYKVVPPSYSIPKSPKTISYQQNESRFNCWMRVDREQTIKVTIDEVLEDILKHLTE